MIRVRRAWIWGLAAGCAALTSGVHAAPAVRWTPSWFASPEPGWVAGAVLQDQTVREIVHLSAGGAAIRIRLSNAGGIKPLHLDRVRVALRTAGSDIDPTTDRAVTFQGHGDVTVAPGAYGLSDPISLKVAAQSDLAVSLYARDPALQTTVHLTQRSATYLADGDLAGQARLTPSAKALAQGQAWLWLDEVEVADGPDRGVVVAFGDSISDGLGLAPDTHATWPDVLFGRLKAAGLRLSVVNAGISGNRLLHNGAWPPFGPAGLARFDDDVLSQPQVRAVIVLIGINDIGQVGQGAPLSDFVSAQAIEDGLTQLAERAHRRGLKIYLGTLTPFKATTIKGYYSDDKEAERLAVNAWIRANTVFDGVVDFEHALADPAHPDQLAPAFDSGDHLHPSAAGDAALAATVPLSWFGAGALSYLALIRAAQSGSL